MTPLCELARKYKCDKGGEHFQAGSICHFYTPVYWEYLHEHRLYIKSVLEIGVNTGASLYMWREFFPNAIIYGIDNNPDCMFVGERIKTYCLDQSNRSHLLRISEEGPFDLVIDDGSHRSTDQILSMHMLLSNIFDGRMYFIEDLTTDLLPYVPSDYVGERVQVRKALGNSPYFAELLKIIRR